MIEAVAHAVPLPVRIQADDGVCLWMRPIADGERPLPGDLAILDEDERGRAERLMHAEDRLTFIAAHALLRRILAREVGVRPETLAFNRTATGRPELNGVEGGPGFSLSHTRGLVAVAVARGGAVGVDAENAHRDVDALAVADRHFAPPERDAVRRSPHGARTRRFLDYWTLKEAYLKARGTGLGKSLDAFWFTGLDAGRIRVHFTDPGEDDPGRWRFALFAPTPAHRVALAVAAGS